MKLSKIQWVLISYFLVNFIIIAFLWKYIPIWESVLLAIWVILSVVAGYISAYLRYIRYNTKN